MTLEETKTLLYYIKGIHLEFVIDEITAKAWWISLADHALEDVMLAAIQVIKSRAYFDFPKPGHIEQEIQKKFRLEWTPEAITEFVQQQAWNTNVDQVIAACPPNVGKFLQTRWKTLIKMYTPQMVSYITERARCFNARTTQPAITGRVQRMLQGVGGDNHGRKSA